MNIKNVLKENNFTFKKAFGQNFLTDENLLGSIVERSGVDETSTVIEIGLGAGTLTKEIAKRVKKVYGFEIDLNLKPILNETLKGFNNIDIIYKDIMKLSIEEIEELIGGKYTVIANLPYYITTPIIMGLFESHVPIESITIMVQKEVADRMQVGPGTKDYGALSLAVQYYASPKIVANVPANCFMPRPNVGSAVIKLTRHEQTPVDVKDEKLMFKIIRASFNQRRKTLQNSLGNSPELHISKTQIVEALNKMGLSETIRGEALSLEQFAEFSNYLS